MTEQNIQRREILIAYHEIPDNSHDTKLLESGPQFRRSGRVATKSCASYSTPLTATRNKAPAVSDNSRATQSATSSSDSTPQSSVFSSSFCRNPNSATISTSLILMEHGENGEQPGKPALGQDPLAENLNFTADETIRQSSVAQDLVASTSQLDEPLQNTSLEFVPAINKSILRSAKRKENMTKEPVIDRSQVMSPVIDRSQVMSPVIDRSQVMSPPLSPWPSDLSDNVPSDLEIEVKKTSVQQRSRAMSSSLSPWPSGLSDNVPSDLEIVVEKTPVQQKRKRKASTKFVGSKKQASIWKKEIPKTTKTIVSSQAHGTPIALDWSVISDSDFYGDVDSDCAMGSKQRQKKSKPSKEKPPAKKRGSKRLVPASSVTIPQAKPEPRGSPPVWANGRQDLCSAVPYFRAHQGGTYTSKGTAFGFMFDGNDHVRDYIDDAVIISRAGGGLKPDKNSGEMVLTADRPRDCRVKAVEHNIRAQIAVVITLGINAKKAPASLPHNYNVLGYFKPTHAWTEKSDGLVIWRYRFEVFDPLAESWWGTKGQSQSRLGGDGPAVKKKCPMCGDLSLRIYVQGWMCLQAVCANFWRLPNGAEPNESELVYDKRFLHQYTAWDTSSKALPPLRPALMTIEEGDMSGRDTSKDAWKGFVCPRCGMCNSRIKWTTWECHNDGCGLTYSLRTTILNAKSLSTSQIVFPNKINSAVLQKTRTIGNYEVSILTIPGTDGGQIAHFKANTAANAMDAGADHMFDEMQHKALVLERRTLSKGLQKGGTLCAQFSVNYGMPYKFDGKATNLSFDAAPTAVRNSRTLLNWAMKQAFPEADHNDFNESLVLGYFEGSHISYHDDGETGLGPSIATLSLGSPGSMTLRMKYKHYSGLKSEVGRYQTMAPIPGCFKYEERLAINAELERLVKENPPPASASKNPRKTPAVSKVVQDRLAEIPEELGLTKEKIPNAKPIIKLCLNHGDIVIMHGEAIQEYYEHSVENKGIRRFAITCRDILPQHLKASEMPEYEVKRDEGTFDGKSFGHL
ncbi:hypothetical protein EJ05DRAFT_537855 [Pseudovirgaria hyperparasitica]|uniref:Alpha-ketoglutarate-dependent dioxygenase AlkB-like domain-containing protein n=1 Tax=Pseudovirgaria hyperparasitica TaxID=470096 RepID=A0A6A6W8Z6_9PEZI|nr:uncharacterized protein EJ05DRAFT_537855 [Pseudovirgaria hyperparasitica]KAF2758494.1 hypothetical protein EJ05DRAFT_537855 [Pseudovirgaria hyperparasitica]